MGSAMIKFKLNQNLISAFVAQHEGTALIRVYVTSLTKGAKHLSEEEITKALHKNIVSEMEKDLLNLENSRDTTHVLIDGEYTEVTVAESVVLLCRDLLRLIDEGRIKFL